MSTYITTGYLTYIIMLLVILSVFFINIRGIVKNKNNKQIKIVLIFNTIGALFMAIDIYRWISIGYHEELTIFDTVGPLLIALSVYGTLYFKEQ